MTIYLHGGMEYGVGKHVYEPHRTDGKYVNSPCLHGGLTLVKRAASVSN